MQLHHVGIAVADLNASIDLYRSTFGAELVHRAKNEKDGIEAAFLKVGEAHASRSSTPRAWAVS